MNKGILLITIILLGIFSITIISAVSIGEFKLEEDVLIYQTCNNCTGCDFTRVIDEDDNVIISNVDAVKDGTFYSYNISSGNFTVAGDYTYCYSCGNPVENRTGCIDFEMTRTGGDLTREMTTVYILSVVVLFILFVLCLIGVSKLPSKDAADEEGVIIQVSNLKHLRPVLLGVAWGILLAIIYASSNLAIVYLPDDVFANLLFNSFTVMFWMTFLITPFWFIWIFVRIFRDKEMKELISRGVTVHTF